MGRTQPEKPWQELELNLSLRIGTFFDSLQLSFQEKECRVCGRYQIRFKESKKYREEVGGALWKAEQNV